MKIYLDTIGCRLNQAEIETYARQFRLAGHELVPTPEQADLAVINTCTVTVQADADSRQKLRQMARSGVQQIIATGCWATLHPEEAAALPAVRSVVPNELKDLLVPDLLQLPLAAFDLEPTVSPPSVGVRIEREPLPGARLRTRAFIKAQDGCDNHCTYCITTLARGKGRSQPVEAVRTDVLAAFRGGAQEVVLTGVHLGSWGQDFDPPHGKSTFGGRPHGKSTFGGRPHSKSTFGGRPQRLSQLVQAILRETDIPRLRLSSLEPWDLDQEFFGMWQDPRLCRHLHLPLQSGCSATLRRMARKTTPEAFAALLSEARAAIPGVAITTDIMVGFPGEDEAEFAESLAFVQAMQFAAGHVFTFSERPGTAAVRLPDRVPHPVRKARSACMRTVLAGSAAAYREAFVGCTLPVLWESTHGLGPQGWELSGLTDNYLRVTAHSPEPLWNCISEVKLLSIEEDGMRGELLS
jgi:threonylcarbamoyladenosine tRNA methylthiotransferase MtaB